MSAVPHCDGDDESCATAVFRWRGMQNVLEGRETQPVPFLDLKLQFRQLQDGLESVIRPLLASANYIEGAPVAEFEKAFASFCGASEAVAVDSGTAALH